MSEQSAQYQPPPPYIGGQPPARPKRRVFMWFFLAVQALFIIWIISGMATGESCDGLVGEALTSCQAGQVGTGIGVMLIIGLWVAVDVILGIIYLVVRAARR